MYSILVSALFIFLQVSLAGSLRLGAPWVQPNLPTRRSTDSQCQPFHSTFAPEDFASHSLLADDPYFVAVSPEGSYSTNSDGLQLFLKKPNGPVTTKDGVNDKVADGATINSTSALLYGTVTFVMSAPTVPGAVTAAILIGEETNDEIDIELLGGDPSHWQTNVYASRPGDKPLWGVFGEIEDYADNGTVQDQHSYTIDWNAERIIWSVDGQKVRTLEKAQTQKDGELHFPSHPSRIQLGIWDASSAVGTSQWAKGPIEWSSAPEKMTATFQSITVECP